jgi:hypothetical protein
MFNRATFLAALAAAVAAVASLAGAPASDAARPVKGTFYNASGTSGLYAITTSHTISTLQLFCGGNRYDVAEGIGVSRNGSFGYRGIAYGYSDGGRPTGTFKVRLSGRFTSPTRIKVKRSIQGCTTGTASATGTRSA